MNELIHTEAHIKGITLFFLSPPSLSHENTFLSIYIHSQGKEKKLVPKQNIT